MMGAGRSILVGKLILVGMYILVGMSILVGGAQALISRPSPTRTEVAPGVHLFRTAPYGEVGLDGNSIAIISDEGVLVFDTNGTPSAAEAVLAEIRKLTTQPVRYVVNSHWHWDHWYGTEVYTSAFPGVQVIAHEKTRDMMAGPAIEFNKPGLDSQLPQYLSQLEARLAKADPATPRRDLVRLREAIADGRFFLEQKRKVRHTLPNLTYSTAMTVHLDGREIQIRHHDRAVTPGDTFLYLPKEKIVVAGDLLVNPISFALSSYPAGWIKTLEYIDSLDASIIVPGHGTPLNDEKLLHVTLGIFRELVKRGAEAKARGLDPDAARAEILPQIKDLMVQITNDTPAANRAFETQLVDWFLHRVYDELDGALTDAIAPIPVK